MVDLDCEPIRTIDDLKRFEAEKTLDQRLPERSILDVFIAGAENQGDATAITMLMNILGHAFFARAGFSGDHDIGIASCDPGRKFVETGRFSIGKRRAVAPTHRFNDTCQTEFTVGITKFDAQGLTIS